VATKNKQRTGAREVLSSGSSVVRVDAQRLYRVELVVNGVLRDHVYVPIGTNNHDLVKLKLHRIRWMNHWNG
jgi:hypothetical protein